MAIRVEDAPELDQIHEEELQHMGKGDDSGEES